MFAIMALVMGITLQIFGFVGFFNILQPMIDVFLIVQSFWFTAAAIALLFNIYKTVDATQVSPIFFIGSP